MYDFSKRITAFHDTHVTLSTALRNDMKSKRDANKNRIIAGLKDADKPLPVEWINQGGYAQRTMTQPPEGDEASRYDIDMGVVFEGSDAKTPVTTKNWVRDAIASKASNMKNDPVTKLKCVRVVYADGYQCDFPVFKTSTAVYESYELASGGEWLASDPKSMNAWIEERVATLSPAGPGISQLRQIVRLIKYFAKVKSFKKGLKFPSGLVATAIAIECYVSVADRLDQSFRETLRAISQRSKYSPVMANGLVISDEKDTDRIQRLIDSALDAVSGLDGLDDAETDDDAANKVWKKVFNHSFFEVSAEAKSQTSSQTASAFVAGLGLDAATQADRASASVKETLNKGGGSKPWSPLTE